MKLENERDKVLPLKTALTPVPLTLLFSTHRVQIKHLITFIERLAG
ncbi:hypothetical protein PS681_06174 [Pseudomonas fluorescens]|nr:hypothetical protein PS681_06174 [Pseudomonas fluorescens]